MSQIKNETLEVAKVSNRSGTGPMNRGQGRVVRAFLCCRVPVFDRAEALLCSHLALKSRYSGVEERVLDHGEREDRTTTIVGQRFGAYCPQLHRYTATPYTTESRVIADLSHTVTHPPS